MRCLLLCGRFDSTPSAALSSSDFKYKFFQFRVRPACSFIPQLKLCDPFALQYSTCGPVPCCLLYIRISLSPLRRPRLLARKLVDTPLASEDVQWALKY
jgi:hypothetical protein